LRVGLYPMGELETGRVDVRAAHGAEAGGVDDTQAVKAVSPSAVDAGRWALRLGGREFPLGEPVVRLGRALSNDVILADRRVSRRHAQLRWRAEKYHLSDMGSRGGTTVNGRQVRQGEELPLIGGDVISLAGVSLTIWKESEQPSVDASPTPSLPSAEG
jgi:hypothetical protein